MLIGTAGGGGRENIDTCLICRAGVKVCTIQAWSTKKPGANSELTNAEPGV